MTTRPFRFGVMAFASATREGFEEKARRIESLGYDTFVLPDHLTNPWPPIPALTMAAMATTTLRIGCQVFANDFRHPVVLAKEAALIDLISNGRFEFGIGAGWLLDEYERAGITFDPPGVRISRMEEGLKVIRGLWADTAFDFAGEYYTITDLDGSPKPVQKPGPPVFIGGTGNRMLKVAGRDAEIVGVLPKTQPYGGHDWTSSTEESLAERISWVREGAGDRFDQIELSMIAFRAIVTDRPAERIAELATKYRLSEQQFQATPDFQVGSLEEIVERLQRLRTRFGVSYITIMETDVESFSPVVARLSGK